MNKFFFIEPEVAGGLGEHTVMNQSTHPPKVSRLHYEFDGWSGDQLLTSFPCYIVTKELADKISHIGLTGFELGPVEVTTSTLFREIYPHRRLPPFSRLIITGRAGKDDFGIAANDWRLVVSKRALAIIKPLCPADLEVSDYPDAHRHLPDAK